MSRRKTSSRVARRTSADSVGKAVVVEPLQHRLGVVGVEHQRPLGEVVALDPAIERADQPLRVAALVEAQLEHLAPDVAADQVGGPAVGDDPALVHDHQPVAEPLGLLHVVGGEQQGDARAGAAGRARPRQPGGPAGRGRWSARRAPPARDPRSAPARSAAAASSRRRGRGSARRRARRAARTRAARRRADPPPRGRSRSSGPAGAGSRAPSGRRRGSSPAGRRRSGS